MQVKNDMLVGMIYGGVGMCVYFFPMENKLYFFLLKVILNFYSDLCFGK